MIGSRVRALVGCLSLLGACDLFSFPIGRAVSENRAHLTRISSASLTARPRSIAPVFPVRYCRRVIRASRRTSLHAGLTANVGACSVPRTNTDDCRFLNSTYDQFFCVESDGRERTLGHLARAWLAYRRALSQAESTAKAAHAAIARQQASELETQLGWLALR